MLIDKIERISYILYLALAMLMILFESCYNFYFWPMYTVFTDILPFIPCVGTVIFLLFFIINIYKNKKIKSGINLLLGILFLISYIIPYFICKGTNDNIIFNISYIFYIIVFFYLTIANVNEVLSKKTFDYLGNFYLMLIFIANILSFYLLIKSQTSIVEITLFVDGGFRGIFNHYNTAAMYQFSSFVLSIYYALQYKRIRLLYLANIVLCLLFIVMTTSRSVMLAVAIVMGIFIISSLIKIKDKKKRTIFVGLLSILIIIALFFGLKYFFMRKPLDNNEIIEGIKMLISGNPEKLIWYLNWYSNGRFEIIIKAIDIGKWYPYGIGTGNLEYLGFSLPGNIDHPHNLLAAAYLYGGLMGLITLSSLLLYITYKAINNIIKSHNLKSCILLSFVIGNIFISMFDQNIMYHYTSINTIIWITFAFVVNQKFKKF